MFYENCVFTRILKRQISLIQRNKRKLCLRQMEDVLDVVHFRVTPHDTKSNIIYPTALSTEAMLPTFCNVFYLLTEVDPLRPFGIYYKKFVNLFLTQG